MKFLRPHPTLYLPIALAVLALLLFLLLPALMGEERPGTRLPASVVSHR